MSFSPFPINPTVYIEAMTSPEGIEITGGEISYLNLRNFNDSSDRKIVTATFYEAPYPLTLWIGNDYDDAGQYTDEQVSSRIINLLSLDTEEVVRGLFTGSPHRTAALSNAFFYPPKPRPTPLFKPLLAKRENQNGL